MQIINLAKCDGKVIFSSDELKILHISNKEFSFEDPVFLFNNDNNDNFILCSSESPRYPQYIFCFEKDSGISKDMLDKIDTEALSSGFESDLNFVSQTLRCMSKSKQNINNIDLRSLFVAMYKTNDNESKYSFYEHNNSIILEIDTSLSTFKITTNKPEEQKCESLDKIFFKNEFESISIKFSDPNREKILEKIKKRASTNRLTCSYCVYAIKMRSLSIDGVDTTRYNEIQIAGIPSMTIDEMLKFFGSIKKSNTKAETLQECLLLWSQKVSPAPVSKNYLIQINTSTKQRNKYKTPLDLMPVDWILANATRMKILSTCETNNGNKNLVVKLDPKTKSDDISKMLYNCLETDSSIYITALDLSHVKDAISLAICNKKNNPESLVSSQQNEDEEF